MEPNTNTQVNPLRDHRQLIKESSWKDYFIFLIILLFTLALPFVFKLLGSIQISFYLRIFAGIFLLVFSILKFANYNYFSLSYMGYDLLATDWHMEYAYLYPFLEFFLAVGYLLNVPFVNYVAILLMLVGLVGTAKKFIRVKKSSALR